MSNLHEPTYKTSELLKYFVTKKIDEINDNIKSTFQSSVDEFISYLISSIVSIVITALFSGDFSKFSICYKLSAAIVLIISFFIIKVLAQKIIKKLRMYRIKKDQIQGLSYYDSSNRKNLIDDFDNIVCDFILICYNFINKYKEAEQDLALESDEYVHREIMDFYYFEVIYYLEKSLTTFQNLLNGSYICNSMPDLNPGVKIDQYRIKNLLDIVLKLDAFIKSKEEDYLCRYAENNVLETKLHNLHTLVNDIKARIH